MMSNSLIWATRPLSHAANCHSFACFFSAACRSLPINGFVALATGHVCDGRKGSSGALAATNGADLAT